MVRGVPDRPGACTIFAKITAKNIGMDIIVQNVADDGHADISFTVVRICRRRSRRSKTRCRTIATTRCRNISIVGWHGHAALRNCLERGINIIMITTSEIKISVLVAVASTPWRPWHWCTASSSSTRARHPAVGGAEPTAAAEGNLTEIVARMEKMEGLIIEDVKLDESTAGDGPRAARWHWPGVEASTKSPRPASLFT